MGITRINPVSIQIQTHFYQESSLKIGETSWTTSSSFTRSNKPSIGGTEECKTTRISSGACILPKEVGISPCWNLWSNISVKPHPLNAPQLCIQLKQQGRIFVTAHFTIGHLTDFHQKKSLRAGPPGMTRVPCLICPMDYMHFAIFLSMSVISWKKWIKQ